MTKNANVKKVKVESSDTVRSIEARLVEKLVDVDLIDPSPTNPRKTFDEDYITGLGLSMKNNGLINPITLRKKGDRYEIVCGDCRHRGAKSAGLKKIRASVADMTDEEVFDWQIHENLHRKDIHPMDEAGSYAYYLGNIKIGGKDLTLEELSKRVGKDVRYVKNRVLLNNLIEEAQNDLRADILPYGSALVLASYSREVQTEAYREYTYETEWKDRKDVPIKSKPLSVTSLKEKIKSKILLELKHAPFPIKSKELREDGLTCLDCRKRTGADALLFPELAKEDSCMDKVCFAQKSAKFVQIQCRRVAEENVLTKTKTEYNKKIEKAKTQAEEKKNDQTAIAGVKRLEAELREVVKNGVKSDFVKVDETKLEKEAEKVQRITSEYWTSEAGLIGRDSYTLIENPKSACAYAIRAVYAKGDKIGQTALICKNKDCEKHHKSSSSSSSSREVKSGDELKKRNWELYNIRTAETARKIVFSEGMKNFGSHNSIWTNPLFQRLITALLFDYSDQHSTSHKADLALELLNLERKEIVPAGYRATDEQVFQIAENLSALDEDMQNRMMFLLAVVGYGENRHEGNVKQDAVHFLAEELKLDWKRIDAEARVEVCKSKPGYKKFLPIAEQYLADVKAGKKVEAVNYWLTGEETAEEV